MTDEADLCPKCGGSEIHHGYGLAGGGIGPYRTCLNDNCDFFEKTLDASNTDGDAP
jgi:hypothetical protein